MTHMKSMKLIKYHVAIAPGGDDIKQTHIIAHYTYSFSSPEVNTTLHHIRGQHLSHIFGLFE